MPILTVSNIPVWVVWLFAACILNAGSGRPTYYDGSPVGRGPYDQLPARTCPDTGTSLNPAPGLGPDTPNPSNSAPTDAGGEDKLNNNPSLENTPGGTGEQGVPQGGTDAQEKKPLHPKLMNCQGQLEMKDLWDEFDHLGTEMIVTKAGR